MLAWVRDTVSQTMSELASLYRPCETGGCLLGYWLQPLQQVVICDIVGPGPNAQHSRNRFVPDNEWQTSEIGKIYSKSGYVVSYLGDWHSHPNYPNADLSWRDRKTLREIATYSPARAPHPIMGIIAKGENWFWKIWCYKLIQYGFLTISKRQQFDQIRTYKDD
jgi:integrative and conjugative element protein (TIGR02256 family)